jgi:hypothetical protein
MEIETGCMDETGQVDVDGSTSTIPTGQPFFLIALNIPERVADVLEVEVHPMLFERASCSTPVSSQVAIESQRRVVCVRPTKRSAIRRLGKSKRGEQ